MIDLAQEQLLRLDEAAKVVPPSRGGRRTHLSTILRWIQRGARNPSGELIRLEAIRLGGSWKTSREALQRFAEALTPKLEGDPQPLPRTPTARARAAQRAARELERAGI